MTKYLKGKWRLCSLACWQLNIRIKLKAGVESQRVFSMAADMGCFIRFALYSSQFQLYISNVCVCVCPHSVEVVDYSSRVTASEVRHGHSDFLIVVGQVDADIFLQLLTPTKRCVHRVFIQHPAVEQVLLRDLDHTHKHTHTHTHTHTVRFNTPAGTFRNNSVART